MVSLREATYPHQNISKSLAFTVNIANEAQVSYVDFAGNYSGRDMNKFTTLRLTPIKSKLVDAPYVQEFPINIECKVIKIQELGSHTQFIGEVLDVKIDKSCLFDNGYVDIQKVRPIAVGGGWYYGLGELLGKPGRVHQSLEIDSTLQRKK